MNYFINNIKINNLFHLHGFNISIENGNTPHLLLTGKNGTGKTVLLKAIAEFLDMVKNDQSLSFMSLKQNLSEAKGTQRQALSMQMKATVMVENLTSLILYWTRLKPTLRTRYAMNWILYTKE